MSEIDNRPTPSTLTDLITQARTNVDNDAISDLQCGVMALAYWMYRRADCPYGSTHDGLAKWTRERFDEYKDLCGGEE